ncbi:MAG: LacI family DNA-binding transcriptional regulator [Candidatus Nanopelagicales bacterium]
MSTSRSVSAADVARAAGVSTATVSYALNGRPGVSPRTRARILELAATMGHAPTSRISQLQSQKTRVLGLIITDIANPFYTEIAAGIIDAARGQGYEVFLAHTQESQDVLASTIDSMIERRVDGVVLAVLHFDDGNVIRALRRAHMPFVQLSRRIGQVDADFVGIDDGAAAAEMMEHVLQHGYEDVATITGPRNSSASAAREDAFAAVARGRGIENFGNRRLRSYLSQDGGLRAVQRLLASDTLPRALVCGSDAIAWGVLGGLRTHGVRVPEEVAVTGFDGLVPDVAAIIQLTTIVQPRREMATRAVELLVRRLGGAGGAAQSAVLGHQLRIGTTCGCSPTEHGAAA